MFTNNYDDYKTMSFNGSDSASQASEFSELGNLSRDDLLGEVKDLRDKTKRVVQELDAIRIERKKLLFNDPHRKTIATSVDMEVKKRDDEINSWKTRFENSEKEMERRLKEAEEKQNVIAKRHEDKLKDAHNQIEELKNANRSNEKAMKQKIEDTILEKDLEMKRLNSEIAKLKESTKCALEKKDEQYLTMKKDSENTFSNMKQELNEKHSKLLHDNNEEHLKNLKSKTDQLESTITNLRSKLSNTESEKLNSEKTLNDKVHKLESNLEKSKKENNRLSEDLKQKQAKIDELIENLKKIENENRRNSLERQKDFETKIKNERSKCDEDLKAAREMSLKLISEKDNEINDLKVKSSSLTKELDKVNKDSSAMINSLKESSKKEIDNIKSKFEEMIKNLEKDLSDLKNLKERQSDKLDHEIKKLVQERDSNLVLHSKEESSLEERHQKQIEELNEKFKRELEEVTNKFEREKHEVAVRNQEEKERSSREKKELSEQLTTTKEELNLKNAEHSLYVEMKDVELKNFNTNIETLKRERENIVKDFEKSMKELKDRKIKEINSLKTEFEKTNNELDAKLQQLSSEYHSKLNNFTKKEQQLEISLSCTKCEYDSIIKKKDADIQSIKEENIMKIEAINSSCSERLSKKDSEIESVKSSSKEQSIKYQEEIASLKREIKDRTDEHEKEKRMIISNYEKDNNNLYEKNLLQIKEIRAEHSDETTKLKNELRNHDRTINECKNKIVLEQQEKETAIREANLDHDKKVAKLESKISHLTEQLLSKDDNIASINKANTSHVTALIEDHQIEMKTAMEEIRNLKSVHDVMISNLDQQSTSTICAKNRQIQDLNVHIQELNDRINHIISEYDLKINLLNNEWNVNQEALCNQHIINIKVKEEEIDSLNIRIKDLQNENEKEAEHFREILEQYRDKFKEESLSMARAMDELRREKEIEIVALHKEIENLHQEKVRIIEEMKNQEIKMTETHFNEVTTLKTNFQQVKTELEQKLHITEDKLRDVTLQLETQTEECNRRAKRISVLEEDLERIKKHLDEKMEQMSQEISRINEERKIMAQNYQKQIENILIEKKSMEEEKDKTLHETKMRLDKELRETKNELDAKILNLENERTHLEGEIEELKLKCISLTEEKNSEISRITHEMTEKCQNEIDQLRKEYQILLEHKDQEIHSLTCDIKDQKVSFETSYGKQKDEYHKVISERDSYIKKQKEEHNLSCKEFEEHVIHLKQNIAKKTEELKSSTDIYEKKIAENNAEIKQMLKEIHELGEKYAVAEADSKMCEARKQEVEAMEAVVLEKHDQIASLQSSVKVLEEHEEENKEKIKELNVDLLAEKNHVKGCEADIRELKHKIEIAENYSQSLRNDIDEKDKKIGETYQKYQTELYQSQAKDRKIEELRTSISINSSELKKKEDVISVLQKKVDDLSYSKVNLDSSFSSSKSSGKWDSLKADYKASNAFGAPRSSYDFDNIDGGSVKTTTDLYTSRKGSFVTAGSRDPSPRRSVLKDDYSSYGSSTYGGTSKYASYR